VKPGGDVGVGCIPLSPRVPQKYPVGNKGTSHIFGKTLLVFSPLVVEEPNDPNRCTQVKIVTRTNKQFKCSSWWEISLKSWLTHARNGKFMMAKNSFNQPCIASIEIFPLSTTTVPHGVFCVRIDKKEY